MLEEQIAEKERQRQDARSQRRGEGDVQNPMAPLQGRSPAVQPVRQAIGTLGLGMAERFHGPTLAKKMWRWTRNKASH